MKRTRLISFFHLFGYALIFISIAIGFVIARKGQAAFLEYLKEDGLVENLTAIFLFLAGAIAVHRCILSIRAGSRLWILMWGLFAFLFFFAAGEEISWGQRIFNFETSPFFQLNNLQHETNLHNLAIGNVKINKLIFSQFLGVVLGFYLIFLKPLAQKFRFFNRLVTLLGIPLPRWEHIIVLIVSLILISKYHLMKAAELREFAFSIIFFLIFLRPANPGENLSFPKKTEVLQQTN
jgi:hypothetical protein